MLQGHFVFAKWRKLATTKKTLVLVGNQVLFLFFPYF
jgi:hypothetical protein